MSDIRVFVTFPETSTVFAGEKLECKITFKNVSSVPGSSRGAGPPLHLQKPTGNVYGLPATNGSLVAPGVGAGAGVGAAVAGGRPSSRAGTSQLPATTARSGAVSPRIPAGSGRPTSAHKPSLSLSVPAGKVPPTSPVSASGTNGGIGHKHKRSISIVSIGSEAGGLETGGREDSRSPNTQGRARSHGRSASLHTLPRRSPMLNGFTPTSGMHPANMVLLVS